MDTSMSARTADRPRTRRVMLTQIGGLAAAGGLALGGRHGAAAQDSTPAAGGCGVPIGTAVSLINVEGQEIAQLTIAEVTDPFTGYNPAYPPPRGYRFLLLKLTAKNVGVNPWTIDPNRIFLQDTEGFTIYPAGVDLGPEPAVPGLGYQEIPAGAEVVGVAGYVLIKGITPHRVFFAPASDRLLLLAELQA